MTGAFAAKSDTTVTPAKVPRLAVVAQHVRRESCNAKANALYATGSLSAPIK